MRLGDSLGTYMAIRYPSRALSSLQPLNELRAIRNHMIQTSLRGYWFGGALEDGSLTKLSPDALFRETMVQSSQGVRN